MKLSSLELVQVVREVAERGEAGKELLPPEQLLYT